MSQSETWDALCLAAEWRAIGREAEAARVMPDPEVKWVRVMRAARYPAFFERRQDDEWDDPQPARGEQIREHRDRWDRHDWLAWMAPIKPLNTSAFDPMLREHYNPHEVARMAMARNSAFQMLARSTGGKFVEKYQMTYMNPTTYERLRERMEGRITESGGITRPTLPRRGVVAALRALPGWPKRRD